MTLLSPWWLLLVPLLYGVIILHTMHPQRHRVLVPSTLLWQRVLRKLEADARWHRLVANLLLLVQLAALLMLILALTRPAFLFSLVKQRHDIYILDVSASMAATDLEPNRLQVAKTRLAELIRADRPRRVSIITAGPQPQLVYTGNASLALVNVALQRIQPSEGGIYWPGVAAQTHTQMTEQTTQVVFISDGAMETHTVTELVTVLEDTPLRFERVGGNGNNVGIVSFEARQRGASLTEYEVLITLANYGMQEVQAPLTLSGRNGAITEFMVTLAPDSIQSKVIPYQFQTQDVLQVTINIRDALAVDNAAYLTAYPPTPTRVLLVGPGNYYLETGLSVFPQVRLERRLLYPEQSDYPLVVFDRIPIPESFIGNALYLAGAPSDRVWGTRQSPQVTWFDRTHPLTRFITWNDLYLQQAFSIPRLEGARILVESEAGPLLQLTQKGAQQVVTMSFALEESDWPLKVSFPIFLSHLLRWAHPEGWEFVRNPLTVGDSLTLPASFAQEQGWSIRLPDQSLVKVAAAAGPTFRETWQVGVYTVLAGENEFSFAVNAGSVGESNLRTRLQMPTNAIIDDTTLRQSPFSLTWLLALLALILILFEGWLYTHRIRRPVRLGWPRVTTLRDRFRQMRARRG
jgi:Ca-activated chloride channel family protein